MTSRLTAFYEKHFKKRPQQPRSLTVVDALLTAAMEGLARGADDVSLKDVARRAGVGIGSFYDYFRDRSGLFAIVVAKVTETNLSAFESCLRETRDLSLHDAVARVVDFAFDLYTADSVLPRTILQIAHRVDLMPMLIEGQTLFSSTLARELAARPDVAVKDPEVAAYVVTQAMMGLIHSRVWEGEPKVADLRARRAFIEMLVAYLRGDGAPVTGIL